MAEQVEGQHTEETKEKARELRRDGITMTQIAKRLGVPRQTLYRWGVDDEALDVPPIPEEILSVIRLHERHESWPGIVKEQVFRMISFGMPIYQIAGKLGIPEFTVRGFTASGDADLAAMRRATELQMADMFREGAMRMYARTIEAPIYNAQQGATAMALLAEKSIMLSASATLVADDKRSASELVAMLKAHADEVRSATRKALDAGPPVIEVVRPALPVGVTRRSGEG